MKKGYPEVIGETCPVMYETVEMKRMRFAGLQQRWRHFMHEDQLFPSPVHRGNRKWWSKHMSMSEGRRQSDPVSVAYKVG